MSLITWPDSGELTRRITIRPWADTAAADFGIDQTLSAGIERWAKVQPVSGVIYWAGKQIGNGATHLFWVRYGTGTKPTDITGEHVIDWNSQRYRVLNATNPDDANAFTMIEAQCLGAIS